MPKNGLLREIPQKMQKFGLHRSLTSGDVGSNTSGDVGSNTSGDVGSNNARSLVHQDNRAALGFTFMSASSAGTTTGKL